MGNAADAPSSELNGQQHRMTFCSIRTDQLNVSNSCHHGTSGAVPCLLGAPTHAVLAWKNQSA